MKYEALCLAVKDIKESKNFYQNLLGLEIDSDWGVNVAFKGGIALHQGFEEIIGGPKKVLFIALTIWNWFLKQTILMRS